MRASLAKRGVELNHMDCSRENGTFHSSGRRQLDSMQIFHTCASGPSTWDAACTSFPFLLSQSADSTSQRAHRTWRREERMANQHSAAFSLHLVTLGNCTALLQDCVPLEMKFELFMDEKSICVWVIEKSHMIFPCCSYFSVQMCILRQHNSLGS